MSSGVGTAMAATPSGPAPPTLPPHERRAVEQLAASLAAVQRESDLASLLEATRGTGHEATVRFYVALSRARHDLDEALHHLEAVLAHDPRHERGRKLAYRLLLRQARRQVRDQSWDAFSETLRTIGTLAPDPSDRDLAALTECLPLAQLRSGNREKACSVWEGRLRQSPEAGRLIHCLALAHYWTAVAKEARDPAHAMDWWYGAIAFWITLSNHTAFWEAWNAKRGPTWGHPLSADDLARVRTEAVDAHLRAFQDRYSEAAEEKRHPDADRYEDYVLTLLRERESARYWGEALQLPGLSLQNGDPVLTLPGGYAFFERMGALAHVRASIETLRTTRPDAECLPWLLIYFCPDNLGRILLMVDQRHRPDAALAMLDRLERAAAEKPEARYVHAQALAASARLAATQKSFAAALASWKAGHEILGKLTGKEAGPFRKLASVALEKLQEEMVAAVQKEANRLKSGSLDGAITLLEDAYAACGHDSIKEYLCIFYCDRAASRMAEKRWSVIRADFERALKLKPGYPRARKGLATTYNNEGCEIRDDDRSIALLEKALEYEPDDPVGKTNLALAYKNKAIAVVNALSPHAAPYTLRSELDRSIALLEKAAKLVNPKVGEVLFLLEALSAKGNPELLLGQANDPVMKGILSNLSTAYNIRSKVRGY